MNKDSVWALQAAPRGPPTFVNSAVIYAEASLYLASLAGGCYYQLGHETLPLARGLAVVQQFVLSLASCGYNVGGVWLRYRGSALFIQALTNFPAPELSDSNSMGCCF